MVYTDDLMLPILYSVMNSLGSYSLICMFFRPYESGFVLWTFRKSADPVVQKSAPCSRKFHHRRLYEDVSADGDKSGLRLDIAARSAPTSGVSSPMISPGRPNGGELSPPSNSKDSAEYPSKYAKGQSLFLNFDSDNSKLSHIVSPRSAPMSGISSPALSPQRSNTADFLPSFMVSHASPARLDLEALDLGRVTGQTSPVKTARTPDRSPFHCQSFQIPCPSPKNCNKFSFSPHNKLLPGNSKEWLESNNSAHPLPLPPEATQPQSSLPLPPPIFHHNQEYPNLSLRKPQWQKGKFIGRGTYGSVYVGTNRYACILKFQCFFLPSSCSALNSTSLFVRETGALCAIKEVDIIPDDPKSAECIKQLEQVSSRFPY